MLNYIPTTTKWMIVKANSLRMRLECLIRRVTVIEKDAFRCKDVRAVIAFCFVYLNLINKAPVF